jgi:hypothetical protein
MGGSLTEARKRLPSFDDLEQAAALLNVPGLDDADRNTAAPPAGGAARQITRLRPGLQPAATIRRLPAPAAPPAQGAGPAMISPDPERLARAVRVGADGFCALMVDALSRSHCS